MPNDCVILNISTELKIRSLLCESISDMLLTTLVVSDAWGVIFLLVKFKNSLCTELL